MCASRMERTRRGDMAARVVVRLCQAGIAVLFGIAAWVGTPPPPAFDREAKVIVFPPAVDRAEQYRAVAAAEGLPLGTGWLPNVIFAIPGGEAFARGVRTQGAWLVLDARGPAGCLGW